LELHELTFLTDRGEEIEELSAYVKTAAYNHDANGKVDTRHKEISMLRRLYDCDSPVVAEMWRISLYGVFQGQALLEAGGNSSDI